MILVSAAFYPFQAANADVVMKAVLSTKDVECKAVVDSLNSEQCDVLMKYIYRGLAGGGKECGVLLKWHAHLVAKTGLGPIVRTMTDRKAV